MRQHCRNNVTMFSDQQTVDYGIMSIFVAATPFRNPGLNVFWDFFLVFEPLHTVLRCMSRCRCREAKQLSPMPSSGFKPIGKICVNILTNSLSV